MKTKPCVIRLLIVLAVLALRPLAARADVFVDITPGTAAPPATLGGYTMTKFPDFLPGADFSLIASVASPLGGSVSFSPIPQHRTTQVVGSWATWSHAHSGTVYFAPGATSLTLTLPAGTGAFYLYAEPDPFAVFSMSATGTDGTVSTTVSQLVDGLSGAKYFGFFTTDTAPGKAITSIKITSSVAFGVGEFGIAKQKSNCKVPEPSSLALLALGTLGLAAWRRRKV